MEEDFINGQENNLIYMKDSLLKVKEMGEELSGGLMEVGIKDNLEMEYKVVTGYYIEMVDMLNIKDLGIMVCLMEKVHNSFRMVKNIKVHSSKINSMEMVYSIKMIL